MIKGGVKLSTVNKHFSAHLQGAIATCVHKYSTQVSQNTFVSQHVSFYVIVQTHGDALSNMYRFHCTTSMSSCTCSMI